MAIKAVQAVINGVTTTLTLNPDTGFYEADIAAPSTSSYNVNSDHYYPITITATDEAENTTSADDTDSDLGNNLRLTVKESVKPVIVVSSPTEGAFITNNKPTITWNVTDDDSGVDVDTIGIIVDDGEKITDGITKTVITGGYSCTYVIDSALSDGSHTFKFDASDHDENMAVQRTLNITVDTVPPSLLISSPANNLVTNESVITLTGTTNDLTSSPVSLSFVLNGGEEVDIDVSETGAFVTTLALVEGTNTIIVTATDTAGKTTSITRIVIFDSKAPVINSVTLTPNPVSTGGIVHIEVSVTD